MRSATPKKSALCVIERFRIHSQNHRLAYLALIAVCLFWGTTYLGIRIALESIPPLWLIGSRYVISGAILLAAVKLAGMRIPAGKELIYTGICGIICIGVGNGFLAVSELLIPSGLAALFYTTSPFWMIGIDAVLPGGKQPYRSTVLGLCLGFCGVVFLIWPAALREGLRGHTVVGFLLLQLSGIGWVLGSLLQKRVRSEVQPVVNGAVQQLAAGLAVLVPAAIFEQAPHAVTVRSYAAVAYLVIFGSIVGFSSFIYSMTHLPVAIVSIYTFVNPLVAVFLGWLLFREPFGGREGIAMLIIFSGVGVVRWSVARRPARRDTAAIQEVGAILE